MAPLSGRRPARPRASRRPPAGIRRGRAGPGRAARACHRRTGAAASTVAHQPQEGTGITAGPPTRGPDDPLGRAPGRPPARGRAGHPAISGRQRSTPASPVAIGPRGAAQCTSDGSARRAGHLEHPEVLAQHGDRDVVDRHVAERAPRTCRRARGRAGRGRGGARAAARRGGPCPGRARCRARSPSSVPVIGA